MDELELSFVVVRPSEYAPLAGIASMTLSQLGNGCEEEFTSGEVIFLQTGSI